MTEPDPLDYEAASAARPGRRASQWLGWSAIVLSCVAAFMVCADRYEAGPGLILSIVTVALAIASVATHSARGETSGVLPYVAVALSCGTLLLIGLTLPSITRATPLSNRILCQSHLRQIGIALTSYAAVDPRGELPPDLATLAAGSSLDPNAFHCPLGPSGPSSQPPPANWAVSVRPGTATCDYFYLRPPGPLAAIPANAVLLYEPAATHGTIGCNVVYADGQVDTIAAGKAVGVIARLRAGHNPP